MSIKRTVKEAWEKDPVVVSGVGAALIMALAKLMDANTNRKNSKSYRRETLRRERKDRSK